MKRFLSVLTVGCMVLGCFTGCSDGNSKETMETAAAQHSEVLSSDMELTKADTSGMDFSFADSDTSDQSITAGTTVNLSETSFHTSSMGIEVCEITDGGTYTLTGSKSDGMIVVDADGENVTIVLSDVTILNSLGPALYVRAADHVTVVLAEGTTNILSDGSAYAITDSDSTLDAVIFSKADMTINGSGELYVTGNYKHGIVSKDDLILESGTMQITAQSTGLNGKDCVKVNSGSITIQAGSDGICSDNEEDTSKGYVYLYGGSISITAGNDGIQAETVINIEDVQLSVTSGDGSSGSLTDAEASYKALKAGSDIYITGGAFDLDSLDDCIHSNGTITISGGSYVLSSGDDGVHADTDLAISGEDTSLVINKSYEGIEATNLYISDGNISLTASDDGLNAAGGNDTSTAGRPGMGHFSSSTGKIVISGGTIDIHASGDGMDANGTLSITGGTITVTGPNSGDTSILDYDTTGTIDGGIFIGTGSSAMTQNFGSSSTQGALMVNVGTQSSGTQITLTDENGNILAQRTPDDAFSCVLISHPSLTVGETYTLTVGDQSTSITMNSTVYGSSGIGTGGMMPERNGGGMGQQSGGMMEGPGIGDSRPGRK